MREQTKRHVSGVRRVWQAGAALAGEHPAQHLTALVERETGKAHSVPPLSLEVERFELRGPSRSGVGRRVLQFSRTVSVIQLGNGLVLGEPLTKPRDGATDALGPELTGQRGLAHRIQRRALERTGALEQLVRGEV